MHEIKRQISFKNEQDTEQRRVKMTRQFYI